MENKVYELETVWNMSYILNTVWQFFNIAIRLAIVFYGIKLYRKLDKYLDKKNSDINH